MRQTQPDGALGAARIDDPPLLGDLELPADDQAASRASSGLHQLAPLAVVGDPSRRFAGANGRSGRSSSEQIEDR